MQVREASYRNHRKICLNSAPLCVAVMALLMHGTRLAGAQSSPPDGAVDAAAHAQTESAPSMNQASAPGLRKWGLAFGSGADVPAGGGTVPYQSTSVGFEFGVVRYLNSHMGVQAEYDLDFLGIPSSLLNTYCTNCTGADAIVNGITANPVFQLNPRGKVGLYVIGGGGYYWKKTRFLAWTGQEICYPTEGCIPVQSVAASWSSNAAGWDAGGGVTWRLGGSPVKLYAEGRYVWIDNQTPGGAAPSFPPAYYRTKFVPSVIGIRW